MPSYHHARGLPSLRHYDVLGATQGTEADFVVHAGLSNGGDVIHGMAEVIDMGPPLHSSDQPYRMSVAAAGQAELTDDEVQKIRTFVDRHANEHQAYAAARAREVFRRIPEMYIVLPHAAPLLEADGRYARVRFSCAGFVVEAYKAARIPTVDTESLPNVDLREIELAYPEIENRPRLRNAVGLTDDGPWPVLLCGYLFHALDRTPEAIRQVAYVPQLEDRYYPRRS